jgi:hypothetical protein
MAALLQQPLAQAHAVSVVMPFVVAHRGLSARLGARPADRYDGSAAGAALKTFSIAI